MSNRRLLLVHAHPDDESIGTGATMARYVAEGAQVTLVTCTLGELGEVLAPDFVGLRADHGDQLGGYRVAELAAAMRELGVDDHRFLGGMAAWRDSGMMGTPGNEDPRAFWRCASDEDAFATAVDHAVAVIREVQPQVLVTYDEIGGYGHPDHIMAHRVAMAAAERAALPGGDGDPWRIDKVYWTAIPKSILQLGIDALKAAGKPAFFDADDANGLPFGNDDDEITSAVDGSAFGAAKVAALRAHRTQIDDDSPFFALTALIGTDALATEHFRLVRGEAGPDVDERGWETDLFSGVA